MDYFKMAVDNISMLGDTDIFPFPIENAMFYDMPMKVCELLKDLEDNFDKWLSVYPVECIRTCVPVGYTGFRWATVIDPLWNSFLLSQVIKISDKVEGTRLGIDKESVFSYRIKLDEDSGKLFNQSVNWRLYYKTAMDIANNETYSHIIRFDISDFYNRIYHHRLDNALKRSGTDENVNGRIKKIIQDISVNVSYGLPVGGNAARILAELLLNSMDQMMAGKKYRFCRFVDDYILFASSREDAFRKLNWCAEYLLRNDGLSLQKSKTIIQTKAEFLSHAKATIEGEEEEGSKEKADFLKLHIHYDPYSATADKDYAELKQRLEQFDIISLIKREIRKSRIHQALGKQLMNAVTFLNGENLNLALNAISSNFDSLFPIFPSVMQVANKKLPEASEDVKKQFIDVLCKIVEDDSYLIQTDNNASYVVRVLSVVNTEKSIQAIELLNARMTSPLVRSNCIYAMTNLNNHYWLSDLKSKFSTLSKWERRAFIASSYYLRDEGSHWRDHTKEQFTRLENLTRDWIGSKNVVQSGWKLPL
jgi:hypothetical protein